MVELAQRARRQAVEPMTALASAYRCLLESMSVGPLFVDETVSVTGRGRTLAKHHDFPHNLAIRAPQPDRTLARNLVTYVRLRPAPTTSAQGIRLQPQPFTTSIRTSDEAAAFELATHTFEWRCTLGFLGDPDGGEAYPNQNAIARVL